MDIKFLTLYICRYMYIELLFKFKLDLKFFITLFINVYIHKFNRENFLKKKKYFTIRRNAKKFLISIPS